MVKLRVLSLTKTEFLHLSWGTAEGIPEGEYRVTVVWPDQKVKSGEDSKFGVAEPRDPPDLLKENMLLATVQNCRS